MKKPKKILFINNNSMSNYDVGDPHEKNQEHEDLKDMKLFIEEWGDNTTKLEKALSFVRAFVFQDPTVTYDTFQEEIWDLIFRTDIDPETEVEMQTPDGVVKIKYRDFVDTHMPFQKLKPEDITGFESIAEGGFEMLWEVVSRLNLNFEEDLVIGDLGCGIGGTSNFIAELFSNAKIHAVNTSELQLKRAMQRTQRIEKEGRIKGEITYHKGNIENFEFSDKLDRAILFEVLLHTDREQVFRTLAKNMKEGGTVVATEVGFDPGSEEMQDFIEKKYGSRFQDAKLTKEQLEKAGFTNVEIFDASEFIKPFVYIMKKRMEAGVYDKELAKRFTELGMKAFKEDFNKFMVVLEKWRYSIIRCDMGKIEA